VKVAITVALVLAAIPIGLGLAGALSSDDRAEGPTAIAPAPQGPFKAGHLPDGVRGTKAFSFELRDARGGATSTRELAGKPYALTFLYTNCPDVCPAIAAELRRALELLGPRADETAAVAVSVDPRGDTEAAAREFLERHRLPANVHYLIGTESQLKPVWDAYYAAPQIPGRAESAHTASIWLIDRRARIRTKFSAGAPVPPADIAHDLDILIRER
jgi:protein SCO1/2